MSASDGKNCCIDVITGLSFDSGDFENFNVDSRLEFESKSSCVGRPSQIC